MNRWPKLFIGLALLAGALLVSAADAVAQGAKTGDKKKIGVKPIDVESVTNDAWKVTVALNKADRTYNSGEEIVIKVTSEQPGYLYLFNVTNGNTYTAIFPNPYQKKNEIGAGQEITVPSPGDSNFRFKAKGPAATEAVLAVVFRDPPSELKPEELTRGSGPKSISRLKLKRLIVVDGMGGNGSQVDDKDKEQGQLTVQKEKERIQQQDQQQYQVKMKQWASASVEFYIVESKVPDKKGKVPEKGKK
jgi:hypothetical protein